MHKKYLLLACTLFLLVQSVETKADPTSDWQSECIRAARLWHQQDLPQAESAYRVALRTVNSNRAHNPEDVATVRDQLAFLLQAQGRTEEAKDLYKKSLGQIGRAHV